MLLQFQVSNFMSIRDDISLSLNANNAGEHEANNIVFGKDRILSAVAIYGANSVGKTNIFKELAFAIMFVRNSHVIQINNSIKTILSFWTMIAAICQQKLNSPTYTTEENTIMVLRQIHREFCRNILWNMFLPDHP